MAKDATTPEAAKAVGVTEQTYWSPPGFVDT